LPSQNFRVKNGLEVGTGATISSGGNITAGIISATSFVGNGSQLTGIVATGTVNYANVSGVSSSVVGGAVSATNLLVTGISTFEGAISVRNGYNLNIGDNNDLRIYNDGTDSRIEETGSGSLYILGSDINIQQHSTNETIAKFIGGGAVELYYNDNKKLETTGTGVTVTGTLVADQINVSGVVTASSFSGNASSATYSTTSGISSYSTSSGIATYSTTSGISSYSTSSGIATYSTTSGISTSVIGGIGSITQLQVTGNASVSENLGIGTTNPPDKLTVSGKIQIQQDSGSNNRIVFRGQPDSSYRWNIDNYSSSNEFRIYREDDATSANGFVAVSITTNGQVSIASTVRDSSGNVRTVPANAQTSAYILAASDVGKHVSITTGGVTVNSGIFSPGDAVSIYNNSGSNQTITQGTSVTMYLVGTATTGNRTLAQRGVATILCVGTNTFVIMGGGLT